MMIEIDSASPTPPFEQLRIQLIAQITGGHVAAGQRLPTVRKLAEDLGLAPNTVARAYKELESGGFVETHGRNGTVVQAQGDAAARQAQAAAQTYAETVARLGVPRAEAMTFVTRALGA